MYYVGNQEIYSQWIVCGECLTAYFGAISIYSPTVSNLMHTEVISMAFGNAPKMNSHSEICLSHSQIWMVISVQVLLGFSVSQIDIPVYSDLLNQAQ